MERTTTQYKKKAASFHCDGVDDDDDDNGGRPARLTKTSDGGESEAIEEIDDYPLISMKAVFTLIAIASK